MLLLPIADCAGQRPQVAPLGFTLCHKEARVAITTWRPEQAHPGHVESHLSRIAAGGVSGAHVDVAAPNRSRGAP